MTKIIGMVVLAICVASYARQSHDTKNPVVLPSSRLIGCKTAACSQVWPDDLVDSDAMFPQNISIDVDAEGVLGVVARYSKSTPLEEIRASINNRYGEWVFPKDSAGQARLWRVEPEKVAIQLAEEKDGTKEVIYLFARAWLRKHGSKAP